MTARTMHRFNSTDAEPARGWLLFDADCSFCAGLVLRLGRPISRRGFALTPLQAPWVKTRLGITTDGELLREMRLLTPGGEIHGGAAAAAHIARTIWWSWPLWAVSRLPGALPVMDSLYRRIAARRHCMLATHRVRRGS
jgi:predicted DCC family thiol-disulfide oxidoreductase YuxK